MSNRKRGCFIYLLGFGIGWVFIKTIKGIAMLLWKGIIVASINNLVIALIYVGLVIATIVSYFVYGNVLIMITIIFLCAIVFAIIQYYKELPLKQKRQYYDYIFHNLNFYAPDKSLPYYLDEKNISDFLTAITFRSLIPVSFWMSRKELLEMHMNVKIVNITQSHNDKRIISVHIQKQDLPSQVDWQDGFINRNYNVLNIGIGLYGTVGMDLDKYPHAFIAGETGSGKSNILKCLIHQSINKGYDVTLIDFKRGVSFSAFSDILDIHYEYDTVTKTLNDLVTETKKRLDMFRQYRVDNITDYNRVKNQYLKRKVVFIDELAELLKTRDKNISNILNDSIETLTRLSRAVGIHLIMGIQRPDSTIISGQIKNNVPYRVCGRFTDREPSRIMLASDMASTLVNIKGRFIVKDNYMQEIQAFYYVGGFTENKYNKPITIENKTTSISGNQDDNKIASTQPKIQDKPKEEPKSITTELEFDFNDIKL